MKAVRRETEWVHYDPAPRDPFGPSATPIYQTATFRVGEESTHDYTRSGNPTRDVLEGRLALLERGSRASAFASGMAAIDAVASLVSSGGTILALADLYGGTYRFFTRVLSARGVRVMFVEGEEELLRAVATEPELVFLETPTNPLERVTDLYRLTERAREHGSLVAVDNSLLSPFLQNPLECGADLVIHSATKGLSGHADVTAGVVVARCEELSERIAFHQNACGSGLAPFESFLLLRGMKTLPLRIERQQRTAARIARLLREHPAVRRVHYPGLPDHPGRDVHFRQARGAGAIVSFETGSPELAEAVVGRLELFGPTVSFGSVGSTVCVPARMSHASIPEEVRRTRRFPEDLVRLSIGIEHPEDLSNDVRRALELAQSPIGGSATGPGRRRTVPSSP